MAFYSYLSTKIIIAFITKSYQDLFGVRSYINAKHWHGAAANSWFAHLAFELSGENTSNEWLEPVTDEEYDKIQMLP